MKALHLNQSKGDKTHSSPASPLPGSMRMFLLTDSVLPEIDGLELTRRFRAVHPEIPVLMFTDSLLLPSRGIDNPERLAVLGKPFDVDELVRKVRTLLDTAAPLPIRKPSCWPPG